MDGWMDGWIDRFLRTWWNKVHLLYSDKTRS